ncbi:FeS assembly SUF system protein [Aureimonas jatrophae]|uniref:FeS assembly SUF system protein n=2 Tax=Aureimonas jatrophae TaxID=1166073 RepID=A0A1H0ME78_9HYPH|nr:FeS assembly SUF system protein [Aureimonas jatrophae]SDO78748.1 FeS assembly SUF system protein [Aureimonas jatrophae]
MDTDIKTLPPDDQSTVADTATANVAMANVGTAPASAIPAEELTRITDDIVAALKTVYDPEIPADIYELGLIYKIDIDDDRNVDIQMTLTAPGCPVAGEMPGWVENAVGTVEGVQIVRVELVFDPPWTPERMSEEAQVAVGWY